MFLWSHAGGVTSLHVFLWSLAGGVTSLRVFLWSLAGGVTSLHVFRSRDESFLSVVFSHPVSTVRPALSTHKAVHLLNGLSIIYYIKVSKHGFCCQYPVNRGFGGDISRITATRTIQRRCLRSMAVALYVSFDIVFAVPDAEMHIAWYAESLVS